MLFLLMFIICLPVPALAASENSIWTNGTVRTLTNRAAVIQVTIPAGYLENGHFTAGYRAIFMALPVERKGLPHTIIAREATYPALTNQLDVYMKNAVKYFQDKDEDLAIVPSLEPVILQTENLVRWLLLEYSWKNDERRILELAADYGSTLIVLRLDASNSGEYNLGLAGFLETAFSLRVTPPDNKGN